MQHGVSYLMKILKVTSVHLQNKEITVDIPKSIRTCMENKSGKTIAELVGDYKKKWDTIYILYSRKISRVEIFEVEQILL